MNLERYVSKLGSAYIVWMMIVTRLGGLIGGAAVVYYVRLTLDLSGAMYFHFSVVATIVVLLAITATVALALWETRSLRHVLRCLHLGHTFTNQMGREAGREAVVFPVQHHLREAFVVPLCCLPPVYIYLTLAVDASFNVLLHITIAAFLGISSALSLTYFTIERLLYPVVRHLADYGVVVDYDDIPIGRLQNRLTFSFTLIVIITAVMIATLANQKVADLVGFPGRLEEVVASLRIQTILISGCAVLMALTLSTLLARSVTTRVSDMVRAIRRVEAGHLDERVTAISTDEIGMVGRSFNKMVAQLEQKETVIRELHTNLERKVVQRTQQLAESKRELQSSFEQLKEHDRLKTTFFSNVSHELRTPLTLILAPVENLLDGNVGSLEAEQRGTLEIVQRNTARLLNLINDLLDFAKIEAGKSTLNPEPTDINELIDELVSSASVLALERGIRLNFERDESLPMVMLDRGKIEKVVINLISNALKFTKKHGWVDVACRSTGEQIILSVRDTGIGIAPDDHGRVFQRFVQIDGSTARRYEGTGLGLPLVKEFTMLHGGQVTLESKLGKGSCFSVEIPLVKASDKAAAHVASHGHVLRPTNYSEMLAPAPSGERAVANAKSRMDGKILIVDDSPDILAVLQTVLAPDYHVIEACDGERGLRLAAEELPDIIISDVMMPRMDGNEFCARIRSDPKTEHIGFIMITAKVDLATKIEGLEQGADDYLVKPFNVKELRARVRSLLKIRKLDGQLQKRNVELESMVAKLKQTQDHLVHSEKMSSLGQLAAGIAHEINNAINAVYNGIGPLREQVHEIQESVCNVLGQRLEQVADKPTENGDVKQITDSLSVIDELAEVVETGARRTAAIVMDLKRFSHPGRDAGSVCDVHESLDVAINLLSNKLKNRVPVHRDFCDDGKLVSSGSQLTQVFLNLLDNAQQAITGPGDIYIHTLRDEEHMTIRIRDTGAGMSPEIRRRVFDPFFTTKEVGVGTGMGLSISYGIIKSSGGTIDVASPPRDCDTGTEFKITLPLNPTEESVESSIAKGVQAEVV